MIGIYEKEIYIQHGENYGVLRYVKKDVLDELRTVDGLINYCWDDLWKQAVMAGKTTLGLHDWLNEQINGEDTGEDEWFPGKDDTYLDELTDDERQTADDFILENYGDEVGTWECSGMYHPNGEFDTILRKD